MTIRISFSDKTVRVAVEINGAIESKITELPQRTWVGLTDKEMLECLRAVDVVSAVSLLMSQYEMPPTFKVYAEAIEDKLKEKNT
jgi:hypothetical protein